MPNISSLNTAYSGLNAQRRVLDVTAHNIANANTKGYHVQRVDLVSTGRSAVSGLFSGTSRTNGVNADALSRSYDDLLTARAAREDASLSSANTSSSTMNAIEQVFPEPGDNGIAQQLDQFWSSWSAVATSPGSSAARTELLAKATTLTASLNRGATDLQSIADAAATRTSTLAVDVNTLATQLADVNRAITTSVQANPDLLDHRDVLLGSLSKLTGATTRPAANGLVDVYIGNRALVVGEYTEQVDGTTGTLVWTNGNQPVSAPSGEAAALAATTTDVIPRYRASLDAVAASLVSGVNALHTVGYDQTSTTGRNFFDPTKTTAATISLSIDVAGTPGNIAAGAPVLPGPTAPGLLDGDQARAIARLADSVAGPNATYRSLINNLATETNAATSRAALQTQVAAGATRDADAVGSVSLDEEMATLVSAQRAYEANARVIKAVDDMLSFLIQTVGR
ncbi:MAG: flagellar hook-associated protein FlgK [Ilumatobacteraceae bacterium]